MDRIRSLIAASETPIKWIVLDASSINVLDTTSIQKFYDLVDELAAHGIVLAVARAKTNLDRFFRKAWLQKQRERDKAYQEAFMFPTLKSAIQAFNQRAKKTQAPTL